MSTTPSWYCIGFLGRVEFEHVGGTDFYFLLFHSVLALGAASLNFRSRTRRR